MGTEKSRKERINELYKTIRETGKINAKQLYADFAIRYGCTFRTFYGYLKILEISGNLESLPSFESLKQEAGL